jgi:PIN domain nuclease of toxin-antitoxin system
LRLLLDTHALLWALEAPQRLPAGIRAAIEDTENDVFASAASAWEISIKQSIGKLPVPLADLLETLRRTHLTELPVTLKHAQATRLLPPLHRDPFDRMLVAQAQMEGLSLVSRDPLVRRYPVTVLWGPELRAPRAPYRVTRKPRRR